MEEMSLALRGALLGFAIAAPVGPIGVLVIRRTLAVGPKAGLVSGLSGASGLLGPSGLFGEFRDLFHHHVGDLFGDLRALAARLDQGPV